MLLVEERVDVVYQAQSGLASSDSRLGRDGPSIELLTDIAELIVVSVEGVESTEPDCQY